VLVVVVLPGGDRVVFLEDIGVRDGRPLVAELVAVVLVPEDVPLRDLGGEHQHVAARVAAVAAVLPGVARAESDPVTGIDRLGPGRRRAVDPDRGVGASALVVVKWPA